MCTPLTCVPAQLWQAVGRHYELHHPSSQERLGPIWTHIAAHLTLPSLEATASCSPCSLGPNSMQVMGSRLSLSVGLARNCTASALPGLLEPLAVPSQTLTSPAFRGTRLSTILYITAKLLAPPHEHTALHGAVCRCRCSSASAEFGCSPAVIWLDAGHQSCKTWRLEHTPMPAAMQACPCKSEGCAT